MIVADFLRYFRQIPRYNLNQAKITSFQIPSRLWFVSHPTFRRYIGQYNSQYHTINRKEHVLPVEWTELYCIICFFLWWRAPQQKLRTHRSLEAYCATLWWRWKIISLFFIFRSNGATVEWNWQRENRSTRGKTCPRATLSTTNSTCTDKRSNPGLRGGRPATNRLAMARPV
jgi:hypothetical protein